MPLFADADVMTGATILNCVLVVANLVIGYLTGRDKLTYAAERIELKAKVDGLTAEVAECKADRTRLEQRLDLLHSRMESHGIDCTGHPAAKA